MQNIPILNVNIKSEERKVRPQSRFENAKSRSAEQHQGEKAAHRGARAGPRAGSTEILDRESRLPQNAANVLQGQGWASWHNAYNE